MIRGPFRLAHECKRYTVGHQSHGKGRYRGVVPSLSVETGLSDMRPVYSMVVSVPLAVRRLRKMSPCLHILSPVNFQRNRLSNSFYLS